MHRSILYVDPPAFCATVERLAAPDLRGRPLAVAPPGADRATVLALSPEARAAGIVRGMAVRLARRRCPDLVLLPPNPRLYARASRALHELLRVYAPVIEPRGWGHAFLDLTGTERLFGPARDVAHRLRREAWARLRLPLTSLLLASPTVLPGRERGFLAPRPVPDLPDVPDPIRRRLDEYQLELIGEVAGIPERQLCAVFGPAGRTLRSRALGIDPRPVLGPEARAAYRVGHTHALLRRLTERLGRRLRRRGLAAGRLVVAVNFTDYATALRAAPLREAGLDAELWEASRGALGHLLRRRVAVRRVEVQVDRLVEADLQLDLWSAGEPPTRAETVQQALDRIHDLAGRARRTAFREESAGAILPGRRRRSATGVRDSAPA
jgi:DNA polymerase IV